MNMYKVGDIVRDPYTRGLYRVVSVSRNFVSVVSLCANPREYGSSVRYGWQLVTRKGV